jgi:hypothetical protein
MLVMTLTLFATLLRPLETAWASQADMIDQQCQSKKLFLADFVKKLLFGYLYQVTSLRELALQLQTNDLCRDWGLSPTPFSTLKDGFMRFPSALFRGCLKRGCSHATRRQDSQIVLFSHDSTTETLSLGLNRRRMEHY